MNECTMLLNNSKLLSYLLFCETFALSRNPILIQVKSILLHLEWMCGVSLIAYY